MRYVSAGESHGSAVTAVVEEVPAGIVLDLETMEADLRRRQSGYGRGGRQRIERDTLSVLSGVRFSRTIGSPVTLQVANRDSANWKGRMDVFGERPADLVRETHPRPGHADLVGALRNGTDDCRDILERASARETVARVAAGTVARAMLAGVGVRVISYVTRIGSVAFEAESDVYGTDVIEASPVRCPGAEASEDMCAAIDVASADGDSLGGWFRVVVTGLVPGLGGYASASDRLTGRLGGAIFSIPAIKGVEFGLGFQAGLLPGSQVHDPILSDVDGGGYTRASNNAGGLEGGMTDGMPLVISACMKPIPTMRRPLATVDLDTGLPTEASKERSDTCAVPSAAVVAEAEVALVLADAYQRAFGFGCMDDICAALSSYRERIAR